MPSLSVWEKESFFAPQDVIIIGSGFTGLWSALHLKTICPHYKITILERGVIPTGASTRNAGFSCFGSPSELIEDVVTMGEDATWQLVAKRFAGLSMIREFFDDATIGYNATGGYECFTNNSPDWKRCVEQLSWLNEKLHPITGKENTFTIADEKLAHYGFAGFDHMIENQLEGSLHPGKLVQALLSKVQGLGVQVLTNTAVLRYTETANHIEVSTNTVTFIANQLLLCTNAFTKQLLPGIDITPNRGQVLITSPIPGLPFRGTFHFDKGFYYFRDHDSRLLIGGARNKAFDAENTDEMESTPLIMDELIHFIRRHILPDTDFTVTDSWAGIMAMGEKKSPIVQTISDNIFCCIRMSGMGVALAPVVAKDIATAMTNAVTAS